MAAEAANHAFHFLLLLPARTIRPIAADANTQNASLRVSLLNSSLPTPTENREPSACYFVKKHITVILKTHSQKKIILSQGSFGVRY